jgi:hypothetical protein
MRRIAECAISGGALLTIKTGIAANSDVSSKGNMNVYYYRNKSFNPSPFSEK